MTANILKKLTQFNGNLLRRELSLIAGEVLKISIKGLQEHKTRTFLTMLGIIFGVASVISMLAIGEGARRKTMSQIQALGLNNIIVQHSEPDHNFNKNSIVLNYQDLRGVKNVIPTIRTAVPILQEEMEVNFAVRFEEAEVIGTEPEYFQMMSMNLNKGGYFSHYDNLMRNRVCILGHDLLISLFNAEEAVGKKIRINDVWFTVIGTLEYQPVSVAGNTEVNLNKRVFIPIQTMESRIDREPTRPELDQIILQVTNSEFVTTTSDFVEKVLSRRHNGDKNFKLIVPEQLLKQSEETQRIFNIVMGAIAGISLLVGGIGIMNIMLASILERTKEIGLRRSLGATKLDIRNQFLVEAIIISLGGGIVGIILGYGLSWGVTAFSDWETVVSLWSVLLSVGVSSLVGILFGFFPAKKAAELDPIEALRYE
ncbi:MAG: ABC transporter permease [Candidatus Marinimicrobia bacterium]|nr:ABC transporter permease [Candidatus Neomarinimicrobiota bacterium]